MREERGRGCSFSYFPSLFLISLPNSFVAVFVMPFCFALFIMSAAAVTSFSESSSTRGKSMSLVVASCPWRLPRCLAVFSSVYWDPYFIQYILWCVSPRHCGSPAPASLFAKQGAQHHATHFALQSATGSGDARGASHFLLESRHAQRTLPWEW